MKFNVYDSVVVSAGYDQSVRAWDCRSHSTEPIQVSILAILSNLVKVHHIYLLDKKELFSSVSLASKLMFVYLRSLIHFKTV